MSRPATIVLGLVVAVLLGALCAQQAGLRWNTSISSPKGLYWLSAAPPVAGEYTVLCPPRTRMSVEARGLGYLQPGTCPGGFKPLLKVLAAIEGDQVVSTPDGLLVNGRPWPASSIQDRDGLGRKLPWEGWPGGRIARGQVLVMSRDCETGFDSRYFGPLPTTALLGRASALWTW